MTIQLCKLLGKGEDNARKKTQEKKANDYNRKY